MRHGRKSTGSATSDTYLKNGRKPDGPDAQKPPGKKTKKKRATKLAKAEAANAAVESTPTPSPRDPALDLVAGFHSDKACVI